MTHNTDILMHTIDEADELPIEVLLDWYALAIEQAERSDTAPALADELRAQADLLHVLIRTRGIAA